MKALSKIFFTGLAAVLPVLLTIYILSWLGSKAESVLGETIKLLLPDRWYTPGMGLLAGVVLIFLVGLTLRAWVVRSADGVAAVWVGVVDDLWEFGRPRGSGGPWHDTTVRAGAASDPYLMNGYEHKTLTLRHDRPGVVGVRAQIDLTGDGLWRTCRRFEVPPGEGLVHEFPPAFSAYWIRVVADDDCTATATLAYE